MGMRQENTKKRAKNNGGEKERTAPTSSAEVISNGAQKRDGWLVTRFSLTPQCPCPMLRGAAFKCERRQRSSHNSKDEPSQAGHILSVRALTGPGRTSTRLVKAKTREMRRRGNAPKTGCGDEATIAITWMECN